MRARYLLLGAGSAGLLAACTTLLGDDYEVVEPTTTTSTGTAAGGIGGEAGSTAGAGGAGAGGGGANAGGGGGGVGAAGGMGPGPGTVLWEDAYGDGEQDQAAGVVSLSDGSLVVVGAFQGSLDFGGGALVSGGSSDAFAVRIGANGAQLWAKTWGGAGIERIRSVAVDDSDGLYLFGFFAQTIDFGAPPTLTSVDEGDLFAAKLTAEGDGLWAKRIGSSYIDTAYHVRAFPGGDPVFAGTFQDGITIDATSVSGPTQTPSMFLAKLASTDGQVSWAEVAEPDDYPDGVYPHAVGVDVAGNVAFFAQGAAQSDPGVSIIYDGVTATSLDEYRLLALYRTDSAGGLAWHKRFGTAGAGDIATFPNGDILACGNYDGEGNFAEGFSLPPSAGRDVWVARYGAAGTLVWARRYGGSGVDGDGMPASVRCRALSDGSYVLMATSDGPFDVGGTEVPGTSASVVVAGVAPTGEALWALRTTGPATVVDAAISPNGSEVALVLNFAESVGIETSFDSMGNDDIYLARIAL